MSKAASQYLREVKKRIPCSGSQKTEFLCQLEAEVIYYCEDHDGVDFTILSEAFGSPEEVANDFLSELGGSLATRTNVFTKRFIYIIATVITILAVGISIHTYYVQHKLSNVEYIESITYEGELTPNATSSTYAVEYYYSEDDIINNE